MLSVAPPPNALGFRAQYCHLRLDRDQRHRRPASACTHEAEFAPVVKSTPRIADGCGPESSRQSNAVDSRSILAMARISGVIRYKALKSAHLDHIAAYTPRSGTETDFRGGSKIPEGLAEDGRHNPATAASSRPAQLVSPDDAVG
jgi:hypothetical protein